jgi:hypothetical protein
MATALPTKRLVLPPFGCRDLDFVVTEMQTGPHVVECCNSLPPADAAVD